MCTLRFFFFNMEENTSPFWLSHLCATILGCNLPNPFTNVSSLISFCHPTCKHNIASQDIGYPIVLIVQKISKFYVMYMLLGCKDNGGCDMLSFEPHSRFLIFKCEKSLTVNVSTNQILGPCNAHVIKVYILTF